MQQHQAPQNDLRPLLSITPPLLASQASTKPQLLLPLPLPSSRHSVAPLHAGNVQALRLSTSQAQTDLIVVVHAQDERTPPPHRTAAPQLVEDAVVVFGGGEANATVGSQTQTKPGTEAWLGRRAQPVSTADVRATFALSVKTQIDEGRRRARCSRKGATAARRRRQERRGRLGGNGRRWSRRRSVESDGGRRRTTGFKTERARWRRQAAGETAGAARSTRARAEGVASPDGGLSAGSRARDGNGNGARRAGSGVGIESRTAAATKPRTRREGWRKSANVECEIGEAVGEVVDAWRRATRERTAGMEAEIFVDDGWAVVVGRRPSTTSCSGPSPAATPHDVDAAL